jgi:hypothetical protein
MTKITELGKILGTNTKTRDLFVVVSLDQGEDGTKNITRREVIQALQLEEFDNITITGGTISDATMNNVDINIDEQYSPDLLDENYFYVKDVLSDSTVAISFGDLTKEIAKKFKKLKKIYVSEDGDDLEANGSYLSPYQTLQRAFEEIQLSTVPVSISVLPGNYFTNGELALPDECTIVSTNGQYATKIIMNPGFENNNCILVGSGCYVQGFSFDNLEVDNFDEPSGGFAIAFRPGATIKRSPYIRDCSQISNYRREFIASPLKPSNSFGGQEDLGYKLTLSDITGSFELNDIVTIDDTITATISRAADIGSGEIHVRNISGPIESGLLITSESGGSATIDAVSTKEDFPNQLVGRGGGMLLADRSVLNQNSIFSYMLAFGATPRSPNGLGYVAKNGAGINGISSMSIFQRCSFYALRGAQITLNNSGTQFGDISMRSSGTTSFVLPDEISANTSLIVSESFADVLGDESNITDIIDNMWTTLVANGYTVNEASTRRDAANLIKSIEYDFRTGSQTSTRIFTAGLFNYKGEYVFDPTENAGSGTLLQAFLDSFDIMRDYIVETYSPETNEINMLNGLIDDVIIGTVATPTTRTFGSLIESISHQFNLAGAGVNKNALPLNFRRLGRAVSAYGSVAQENGGRVRWSGADEVNNQFFSKGLRINGRSGKIEGRPFTSSVRRLARRAANSRT